MAEHTATTVETNAIQKYAPSVFSALVLLLGGGQALQLTGLDLKSALTFVVLAASTILVFILPLVAIKWQGAFKTGIEIVSVIATVLISFIGTNGTIQKSQWILIGVAVLKALATEFGIQIRTDTAVTPVVAPIVNGSFDITSLPTPAPSGVATTDAAPDTPEVYAPVASSASTNIGTTTS